MQIIRATKTAEQAGAYYVRIQAMARKHQIPLEVEFDEHDTPGTKYIVIVDDYLPIATCRLYALDPERVVDSVALLRLVNPSTPLRFAGGRRDMSDETAAKCIYVGMSAGIAGPLLTTPGADFDDDRELALRAGYAAPRASQLRRLASGHSFGAFARAAWLAPDRLQLKAAVPCSTSFFTLWRMRL